MFPETVKAAELGSGSGYTLGAERDALSFYKPAYLTIFNETGEDRDGSRSRAPAQRLRPGLVPERPQRPHEDRRAPQRPGIRPPHRRSLGAGLRHPALDRSGGTAPLDLWQIVVTNPKWVDSKGNETPLTLDVNGIRTVLGRRSHALEDAAGLPF